MELNRGDRTRAADRLNQIVEVLADNQTETASSRMDLVTTDNFKLRGYGGRGLRD